MRTGFHRRPMVVAVPWALVAATLFTSAVAQAHKPSDSYLTLDWRGTAPASKDARVPGWSAAVHVGSWDIAIRDLDDVVRLDADGDGAITGDELAGRAAAVREYALSRLSLGMRAGPCVVHAEAVQVVDHSDGEYVRLPLRIACATGPAGAVEALTLDYRLLFDVDPQHRAIVRVLTASPDERPIVLSAHDHTRVLSQAVTATGDVHSASSPSLVSFVIQGALHIWAGLDHMLFLLALLLPSVLRRESGAWQPARTIRSVLADVGRIVTAFTLAHSVTLTLAALGWARMPSRLTEPAIAASVVIAAINNVRPLFGRDRWVVAFALGLLHGFGFSSALSDGGITGAGLATALLGFNLGVEAGQLVLVAGFVPLAFLARRTGFYRRFTLPAGSAAIVVLAAIWFVERATQIRLLPWRS